MYKNNIALYDLRGASTFRQAADIPDKQPHHSPASCPRIINIHHRYYGQSMDGSLELPEDFFTRIAALIAKDDGVHQRILTGDVAPCSTYSLPSRFLQKCLGQQEPDARELWKALDVQSRQDLLLTYECGPPAPQFFADMMMQPGPPGSNCGSYSTDVEFCD